MSKRCDKFNYLCFFSFLVKSIVLKMYHSKAAAFFKAILRSTQVTRLIVFFSLYSKGFCRKKNIEFISIFYMCCRGTGHTTGVKLDFPFEHSLIQKKWKEKRKKDRKRFSYITMQGHFTRVSGINRVRWVKLWLYFIISSWLISGFLFALYLNATRLLAFKYVKLVAWIWTNLQQLKFVILYISIGRVTVLSLAGVFW